MKTVILVIALLTNEGELQMNAKEFESCPDKTAFTQVMEKLKADGKFKDWNALCLGTQVEAHLDGE